MGWPCAKITRTWGTPIVQASFEKPVVCEFAATKHVRFSISTRPEFVQVESNGPMNQMAPDRRRAPRPCHCQRRTRVKLPKFWKLKQFYRKTVEDSWNLFSSTKWGVQEKLNSWGQLWKTSDAGKWVDESSCNFDYTVDYTALFWSLPISICSFCFSRIGGLSMETSDCYPAFPECIDGIPFLRIWRDYLWLTMEDGFCNHSVTSWGTLDSSKVQNWICALQTFQDICQTSPGLAMNLRLVPQLLDPNTNLLVNVFFAFQEPSKWKMTRGKILPTVFPFHLSWKLDNSHCFL